MIARLRLPIAAALLALAACADDPAGPSVPPPAGPAPAVEVTLGFGPAPLEGELHFVLPEGSLAWGYALDLDEDGVADHEGTLERGLAFQYRFDEPGPHVLAAVLTGPDGPVEVEVPVVVQYPDRVRVLGETMVEPLDPAASGFEGIAVDPAGENVYVGAFSGSGVGRLEVDGLALREWVALPTGVEGLSAAPSGDFLFLGFKRRSAARLSLSDLEPDPLHELMGAFTKFFVHALDDRRAVYGGGSPLAVHDVVTGERVAVLDEIGGETFYSWHFDAHPDGDRLVVLGYFDNAAIHVVGLPELDLRITHRLPEGYWTHAVAFDPAGGQIHVLASAPDPTRPGDGTLYHVVLDEASGTIERRVPMGNLGCSGYCVANPVARSRDGRYIAFERDGGAVIVDTVLDLPVIRLDPPGHESNASVATDPTADASFWFLNPRGRLRRIEILP